MPVNRQAYPYQHHEVRELAEVPQVTWQLEDKLVACSGSLDVGFGDVLDNLPAKPREEQEAHLVFADPVEQTAGAEDLLEERDDNRRQHIGQRPEDVAFVFGEEDSRVTDLIPSRYLLKRLTTSRAGFFAEEVVCGNRSFTVRTVHGVALRFLKVEFVEFTQSAGFAVNNYCKQNFRLNQGV